ncbi:MAG: exodeoxyribonuclease VII small subunit [Chloroflexota bacterium]
MSEIETLPFEEALQQLEEIVTKLEIGELNLEDSLNLFEQGQKLAQLCQTQLSDASLRVEQLTTDGEIADISDLK